MHTPDQSLKLREAIEVLWSELPEILGTNYHFFIGNLARLLNEGNDYQIFDLVDRYPEVRRQLVDTIVQLGLYGYPGQTGKTLYRCPKGPHCVKDTEVVHRDDQMKAICPRHNIRIIAVKSCP
jgi:hypothetical protein